MINITLVKDPNGGANDYLSTEKTVENIFNNIMLYPFKNVDGQNVGAERGSEENANQVSPGQMKVVEDNIDKGRVNGEPMHDMD